MLGSRSLAAGEASFDPGDDRHQVRRGIDHVMGAGAVEEIVRLRTAAREIFRRQRFDVGERKTEAIAADGDADCPRAAIDAFRDADRRVVDLDRAPRRPDAEVYETL